MFKDYIEKCIKEISYALDDQKKVKQSLQECCLYLQSQLESSNIGIRYSGTTLVSAVVIKNTLYFCNVGDSRAILASKIKGKLEVSIATRDHNPDIPEEAKRVTEFGGRVSPLIDDDGIPYGPQRVWNQSMTEPGLAMSRSLGDLRAHELGVSSKPGNFFLLIFLRDYCKEVES